MDTNGRIFCRALVGLCAWFVLALPAFADDPDPCEGFEARGIYCTNTPTDIGEWRFAASLGTWTQLLPRNFPSSAALIDAWIQATHAALTSRTRTCAAGRLVELSRIEPEPGHFERNTFPQRLMNGNYEYHLTCTDTSMGYPIQRNELSVMQLVAQRTVGCAPPTTQRQMIGTHAGAAVCIGEQKPTVTLKDLGPLDKNSRASPRLIEATVTNAAYHHAPMGDALLAFGVLTPPGPGGPPGRVLSTTYPGQHVPASRSLGVTDRNGKTLATFHWPQASYQPPVQRVGAHCDTSGQCMATLDLRWNSDVVIGFFNGVANTRNAAQGSMDRLREEFGTQYKQGQLKYDWFYNQTACGEAWYGKVSCLEDVAEVFEQRSLELAGVFANRWEVFWDLLTGRQAQETSFTGRLVSLLGNGANALLQWLDATANALINQLTRDTLKLLTLFSDSPTYENRNAHLERLLQHAREGSRLLLVAHSQGNLFANSAYDALKSIQPDALMQVVHVAPASPTLRGDHALANIDLVINGLRLSGLNSVPDANITLPLSLKDVTGHGFEPTYLDKARAAYGRVHHMISARLESLTP